MSNINDVISGVDEVIKSAREGNFDEAISKTKSFAERATKKSAERLEISRKKIELLDSKTKLAKAYERFGRLCYDQTHGVDIDAEAYTSCLAEIDLQRTRAELLDKEIRDLKAKISDAIYGRDKEAPAADAPEVDVEVVTPEE